MNPYKDKEDKLLELAEKRFPDLTESDKKLFRSVVNPDEEADYSHDDDKGTDPAKANKWSAKRWLGADRIAWLCTDKEASEQVSHKGICIRGARIDGRLDLQFVTVRFPLAIFSSAILAGIDISFAHLKALNLEGTYTGRIDGGGVRIDSCAFLRNGFKCVGGVDLKRAVIGTELDLTGASLVNKDGDALNADGIKVKGIVFMGEKFEAKGAVKLLGASIGGSLQCDKCSFEGGFVLLDASIGGNLQCRGGKFINDGEGKYAFIADRMTVKGNVFMDKGEDPNAEPFEAKGKVRLPGASIGGDLQCSGGKFHNPGGDALNAEQIAVEGHLYLDDGACVTGAIDLVAAKIMRGLSLRRLHKDSKCTVRLDLAHVGTIRDDPTGWPEKGRLRLHGFQYDSISQESPHDAKRRIDWIRRQYKHAEELRAGVWLLLRWLLQPIKRLYDRSAGRKTKDEKLLPMDEFTPQPYEQLAEVLRKEGQEDDSKEIQVAKNWDRLCFRSCGRTGAIFHPIFLVRWFFGAIIGFGYKPWRALYWIVASIFIGFLFFSHAFRVEGMKQTKDWGVEKVEVVITQGQTDNAQKTSKDEGKEEGGKSEESVKYPAPWRALLYSIDSFVPLANLRHAEYWQPDPAVCPGVNAYLCIHIVAGWALTALFAVGLTGKVRT